MNKTEEPLTCWLTRGPLNLYWGHLSLRHVCSIASNPLTERSSPSKAAGAQKQSPEGCLRAICVQLVWHRAAAT